MKLYMSVRVLSVGVCQRIEYVCAIVPDRLSFLWAGASTCHRSVLWRHLGCQCDAIVPARAIKAINVLTVPRH